MKIARSLLAGMFIFTSLSIHAQTPQDELDVIEAALKAQFENIMPYVESWVVSSSTEALTPGAERSAFVRVSEDFARRNEKPLTISAVELAPGAVFDDLSQFTTEAGFDWEAFERLHPGADTYIVRVARPGFYGVDGAVVRMDIQRGSGNGRSVTAQLIVDRSEGEWNVVGGEFPAVRP